MKLINKFIVYITVICSLIATIVLVVDFCCFDRSFYSKEYIKYNTLDTIKSTQDDLDYITDTIINYLKDDIDDLDIMYHENGNLIHAFEDIELIHMVDVKELYLNFKNLGIITGIISIIGLIYIFFKKLPLKKAFISVLVLFFVCLALLFISCLVDFNSFWTSFHKIFFTKNDFWLLDPRTCILVNLFTANFFFDLCSKIFILLFILLFIYYILVYFYEKKICH